MLAMVILDWLEKMTILIILSKSGKSKELYDLNNFAPLKKIPIIFISYNKSKLAELQTGNKFYQTLMKQEK